jgi:hypothetical protein
MINIVRQWYICSRNANEDLRKKVKCAQEYGTPSGSAIYKKESVGGISQNAYKFLWDKLVIYWL